MTICSIFYSEHCSWWCNSYLAGSTSLLSGYCSNMTADDEDDNTLSRLISFDLQHIKPTTIRDVKFDEEICIASLCTFIQFVKDLTANGKVASCIIRFEPGSKRICVLDIVARRPSLTSLPGFKTQLSAADETSSVEPTPTTTPRKEYVDELGTDEALKSKQSNGWSESMPRLRQVSVSEAQARMTWPRRSSMVSEPTSDDNDDNKYKPKRNRRNRHDDEDELNWFHVGLIFMFMAIALIIVPILIDRFHHRS